MTDSMWQTAHAIARDLVQRHCDPNELHKAFVYLRTHKNGEQFFRFLNALVQHGRFLVRSRRTLEYYKAMLEVCQQHLRAYRSDAEAMQQVLGWAIRLMRFYMTQQMRTERRPDRPRRRRRR
ncbi:MAG TPA: hypothetical protein EYP10_03565 [Armatimonadetes bacterium]|nr:hypothetical protein [Armatimonadota bacterium]